MNNMADVSVIIPVYNSGEKLKRAVLSVIKQTTQPKEIIIVDDCSSDILTRQILSEFQNKKNEIPITVLYSSMNDGAGTARNLGWDNASGKYIAFLDSDDVWHSRKIEIQYQYMTDNPDIVFSCHHMDVLSPVDREYADKKIENIDDKHIIPINPKRYLFLHYPRGGTSFVMMLKDINLRFKSGKRYSEDYLLWLETNFLYKGVLINQVMAYSFKNIYGDDGLSKSLWNIEKGELETIYLIRKKKYISFLVYQGAMAFSFCKFLRRCLVSFIREIKK